MIDSRNYNSIAETSNQNGILKTFRTWKKLGEDPTNRRSIFIEIIQNGIRALEKQLTRNLSGIPIIVSGMASSSIGMIELPYTNLPFELSGKHLKGTSRQPDAWLNHELFVISGVRSDDDVMRGEETQIIGAASNLSMNSDQLFIIPGTHSKHIQVAGDKVVYFKTFMTGEIFQLLIKHSVLAETTCGEQLPDTEMTKNWFIQGLHKSLHGNFLHDPFALRVKYLFGNAGRKKNTGFLSGYLIGTELKDLFSNQFEDIILVANSPLDSYYKWALGALEFPYRIHIESAEKALIKGQWIIYSNYKRDS